VVTLHATYKQEKMAYKL